MEGLDKQADKIMSEAMDWIGSLDEQDKKYTFIVANAKAKEDEILSQKDRIEELLGFAADGALGHTFDRRREALMWPVRIWALCSFAAAGFALWWVLHIFQLYPSQNGASFDWTVALLNIIRTSPAFYFLYFVITQYNKERNLQEEYAFKAAVSMTVTAYSDMIDSGSDRTGMLVSTIQSIYAPPVFGKEAAPLIFSTKHLADATKNVASAAASMKSTVAGLTPVVKKEKASEKSEKEDEDE